MTTHDFGTTLPLGICSTCLARMVDPRLGCLPAPWPSRTAGRSSRSIASTTLRAPGAVGRGYGSASGQNWRTNWRTVWRPHRDALDSRRRLSCRLTGWPPEGRSDPLILLGPLVRIVSGYVGLALKSANSLTYCPEGDPRLEPATATSATTGAPGDARHQGDGRPGCGGAEPASAGAVGGS
jgi:hypothetical protein